jgi:hypothetical protein
LRYGIRDKRPCLTPWQRILHQQEKSLEHFPKRCPALRESGPSVMSHLIHYKSDSVEPPHPLSPLSPRRQRGDSILIQAQLLEMDFLKFRQLALPIVGRDGYPNRVVKESHSRGWVLGARGWGRTVASGGKGESKSKFEVQNCPGPSTRFSMIQWLNESITQCYCEVPNEGRL